MTNKQRITLMADWWPRACATQKWNRNDKALRLRVLSQAVGRQIASANELNTSKDIDAVKAHLLTLADNLPAAMDTPEQGKARRTLHLVRQLLAELEELHPEPGAYVKTLLQGIHHGRRVEIGGIEDLGAEPRMECNSCKAGGHGRSRSCPGFGREHRSELEQFHITLNARLCEMRKQPVAPPPTPIDEPEHELADQPF